MNLGPFVFRDGVRERRGPDVPDTEEQEVFGGEEQILRLRSDTGAHVPPQQRCYLQVFVFQFM